MPVRPRRSRWRAHALVLGIFTLLAVLLTWPLITHLTTHVPGVPQWAFDESTFVWNTWYLKHALVDNLASPLHTELIWYPLGIDLILYTYNFYHALAALPLALAVNLPFASNVSLLASTVLSGYGTWLLVLYLLRREAKAATAIVNSQQSILNCQLAAFVAGVLYAFASNRVVYSALGHYDMVTTQWIPFYALMLLRVLDGTLAPRARRRAALLAGLFLAFTGLAEMISALFLGLFTLIALLVQLWSRRRRQGDAVPLRSTAANLVIMGSTAFFVWSPVLIPILREFLTADYDLQGWGDAVALSADLLGWFTPTIFHPLLGGDIVQELRQVQLRAIDPALPGFRDVNTVFLGWASLALAVVGAVAYRGKVAVWSWTAVLFGLFTLGPLLQINGRVLFDLDGLATTVPLPFILLHFIPIIKANRAPNRNSVLLMLGLAVLAGYGVYWILERLAQWQAGRPGDQETRRPGEGNPKSGTRRSLSPSLLVSFSVAALAAGLILFEHLAVPYPLSDARIPAVYDQIAADPRPVSVLQLPLGWRNSFGVFGPEQTLLQYYQSAHGKPMLGGNISRAPDFKLDYFERIPFFQALTEIEFGRPVAPELLEAAKAQAAELMALYDTAYVVLTPPIPDRLPYADTWQASWNFAKAALPLEAEPFWAENGYEAYRVVQPALDDSFRLDLGTAGTYPYRGEGWDAAEMDTVYDAGAVWATGQASRLFAPLREVDPAATYLVRVQVHPFAYPGSAPQTAQLVVNGAPLAAQTLVDGWQTVEWQIPGSNFRDGLNRLVLQWGRAAAPRAVIPGSRVIGSTGVTLPVDADVKAFADGGFMALFDEDGVQSDGSAGRRGVNVTVLDPASGAVIAKTGFDTTASAEESGRLAEFLSAIEPGAPVLVASYGDAWAHLAEDAVAELRTLGADLSVDGLQNRYFAVVGVKGAQPGTAVQVVDPVDAFVRVSLNQDRRPLAAAVDWVEVARAGQ